MRQILRRSSQKPTRQYPAVITRVRLTSDEDVPQKHSPTITAEHTKASPPIVGVPTLSLCSFTYPRIYCPAFSRLSSGRSSAHSTNDRANAASAAVQILFMLSGYYFPDNRIVIIVVFYTHDLLITFPALAYTRSRVIPLAQQAYGVLRGRPSVGHRDIRLSGRAHRPPLSAI